MTLKDGLTRTLRYTAHFSYPLTYQEAHYWLMTDTVLDHKDFLKQLKKIILPSDLRPYLQAKKSPRRLKMEKITTKKLHQASRALKVISSIPFIEFVGLTGSLSMANTDRDSDIDLMVITSPHTLWVTRPLVVFALLILRLPLRLAQTQKPADTICINLYLSKNHLSIPPSKHNFYIAHEILQVRPLFDRGGVYNLFVSQNSWVKAFFANAYHNKSKIIKKSFLKNPLYLLLYPINYVLFLAQKAYMSGKITNETVNLGQAFFHPHSPYPGLKNRLGLE